MLFIWHVSKIILQGPQVPRIFLTFLRKHLMTKNVFPFITWSGTYHDW
uniref:Uncharacterized protein n=1 Tax=Anguilla anguilla TaxID=7936 RepID=A0A0E9UNH5_ANGAN